MWRNVTFWVSAVLVLVVTADLSGFDFGTLGILPEGTNINTLKDTVLGLAAVYFIAIRPIRQIIKELQDGWAFMESVLKHFVALSFLFFTLVFFVAGSENMFFVCFLGFILCCFLKLIAVLSFLSHREHAERVNEYLNCLRDPHKKYVGYSIPDEKPKPKDMNQRWTFEKL